MAEERKIGGNGNNGNSEMTNKKGKVVEKASDSKATNRVAGHKRNLEQQIVLPPDMLENELTEFYRIEHLEIGFSTCYGQPVSKNCFLGCFLLRLFVPSFISY